MNRRSLLLGSTGLAGLALLGAKSPTADLSQKRGVWSACWPSFDAEGKLTYLAFRIDPNRDQRISEASMRFVFEQAQRHDARVDRVHFHIQDYMDVHVFEDRNVYDRTCHRELLRLGFQGVLWGATVVTGRVPQGHVVLSVVDGPGVGDLDKNFRFSPDMLGPPDVWFNPLVLRDFATTLGSMV